MLCENLLYNRRVNSPYIRRVSRHTFAESIIIHSLSNLYIIYKLVLPEYLLSIHHVFVEVFPESSFFMFMHGECLATICCDISQLVRKVELLSLCGFSATMRQGLPIISDMRSRHIYDLSGANHIYLVSRGENVQIKHSPIRPI